MDITHILEGVLSVLVVFAVYTLRKTDAKIDSTAAALATHRLEVSATHSSIRADAFRDFATKLELRSVEKRLTDSNREVHQKLDKLIDRLIDNPPNRVYKELP